jgi:hypothetical protein
MARHHAQLLILAASVGFAESSQAADEMLKQTQTIPLFEFDDFTVIYKNHASASDDDVFG